MELMFKWPTIRVLKCSRRCILILFRSFSRILEDSETFREFYREVLKEGEFCVWSELSRPSLQIKLLKKFLIFLKKTELPKLIKWNLLRFKCLFGLMLLWLITGMLSLWQPSFITLLSISPFSLYLSPLGTMFEMITLFLFCHQRLSSVNNATWYHIFLNVICINLRWTLFWWVWCNLPYR